MAEDEAAEWSDNQDLEWVVTKTPINAKMPPARLTLCKRHFMSYLFYQVLEFYVMGILYKIEKQIKRIYNGY